MGPKACAHKLSARPSQNCQGLDAAPSTVGVFRPAVPTPSPNFLPSVKYVSGAWQLAQETSPLALMRVSKKSSLPSLAAAGSAAHLLLGSATGGGIGDMSSSRNRSWEVSGGTSSSALHAGEHSAASTASAARR